MLQFTPDWLANLFDEDNIRCSKGDYSFSLSSLIEMGKLKALENYLQTDSVKGLKTKDFEAIRNHFGQNSFRPLKLTTIGQTVFNMLGDVSL
jgi:hypothetical protein